MALPSRSVLGLLSENRHLHEELELASEQGRMVGRMADRYRDLLGRILASLRDGTIDVPDVARAVEAEIKEALNA